MGLIRAIVACCVILLLSETSLVFHKSILYDGQDFHGAFKVSIEISHFCFSGCYIYVSVPEKSTDYAKKIFIDDQSGRLTSIVDANSKDKYSRKIPYMVQKGNAGVDFHNMNSEDDKAQFALWIVRGDAPNFDQVEIYDANDTSRASAPAKLITILDAEPFIVTTKSGWNLLPYSAITAGFDALSDADGCTRVIQDGTQDLHSLGVSSPLFTLAFTDSDAEIALTTQKNGVPTFDLTRATFVSSRGYIGCDVRLDTGGSVVFHTTEFRAPSEFTFASAEPVSLRIQGDLRLDFGTDSPVMITADDKQIRWIRTETADANLTVKALKIFWEGNYKTHHDEYAEGYFMVRIEPDVVVEQTTTARPDVVIPSPCPDGFELVSGGQCRGRYLTAMPTQQKTEGADVIRKCAEIQALPIIIHNQEENAYWSKWYANNGLSFNYYWPIGLVCDTATKQWEWADGSAVDFRQDYPSGDLDAACQTDCSWVMTGGVNACDAITEIPDVFCFKQLSQRVPTGCNSFAEDSEDRVCYQVGETAESWQEAQMSCKSVGANMASIHNSQENSFIRRLAISKGAVNGLFLGASVSGKGNDFGWLDGSTWDYSNFYPESNFTVPEPTCSTGPWQENDIITSPGYPFSASLPCDYFLTVEKGQVVQAEILSLEANSCCDRLIIYDDYLGGNVIANLTGAVNNALFTTNTNFMRVSWQPNGGVNVKGWAMVFRGV